MSIVKINAITVPAERADVMAQRFAARAGEVGKADGFEEFQLLRPDDERTTWLVYTRWRDEDAFEAWRASQAFGSGGSHGGGAATDRGGGAAGAPAGRQAHGGPQAPGGPVATGSELWSYRVEQRESAP
jgi:heme-degrading monooxygenase HmoA